MGSTHRRHRLCFNGGLPLEQGVVFEQAIWNIASPSAHWKAGGTALDWHSPRDTLVTLARHGGGSGAAQGAAPTPS